MGIGGLVLVVVSTIAGLFEIGSFGAIIGFLIAFFIIVNLVWIGFSK